MGLLTGAVSGTVLGAGAPQGPGHQHTGHQDRAQPTGLQMLSGGRAWGRDQKTSYGIPAKKEVVTLGAAAGAQEKQRGVAVTWAEALKKDKRRPGQRRK